MWARTTLLWMFIGIMVGIVLTGRAVAELLTALFPDGVPAYDMGDGPKVRTQIARDQAPLGLLAGPFVVAPVLTASMGYTSDALSGRYKRGSFEIVTAPSVGIASSWARDALGTHLTLSNTHFLDAPSRDRTDATITAGGRLDIGHDALSVGAGHLWLHEDPGTPGSARSDLPIAYQVDDVRASYALVGARWRVTPSVDVSRWTYEAATQDGLPVSQSFRDRVVVRGGVRFRYEFAPLRSAVLVVRGIGQDYPNTPLGQASPDSTAFQLLAGLDYNDDAVWHWQVLVGGEHRQFASALYRPRDTMIAEASVIWSPDRLTTVQATVSRETGDAAQEGVSGAVYSAARLTIVRACRRNLLLHAAFGFQQAAFFQGGAQDGTTLGAGMTWVMNRLARVSLTYDQIDLRGTTTTGPGGAAGYSQGVGLATLKLGL